jgi:hypothetical protein
VAGATAFIAVGRAIGIPRPRTLPAGFLARTNENRTKAVAPVCVAVVAAAGIICALQAPRFSIENAQLPLWIDAQRWARGNTARADRFITPPRLEGFRIESERGIFADWKDGTLANFNPAYGRQWLARMALLGVRDKGSLEGALSRLADGDLIRITREMGPGGAVYAVAAAADPARGFETVYRNQGFTIYRVSR